MTDLLKLILGVLASLFSSRPRVSDQAVTRHLIVGVAASAGGLEAFTALLKRLLLDTGFGFVLVQHLDPQHDSALSTF